MYRLISRFVSAATISLLSVSSHLSAAPLLFGKVVDRAGRGLGGVEARLAVLGVSVTTDTTGAFEIDSPTAVLPPTHFQAGPPRALVRDGMLRVTAGPRRTSVKATLYDLHGRTVGIVFDGLVEAGTLLQRPVAPEEMKPAEGTYLMTVSVDGLRESFKTLHIGRAPTVSPATSRGLAKALAVLDTLKLTKSTCAEVAVPITEWNVDLGEIIMVCEGVLPPVPPKTYPLPDGAVRVTNSSELVSALSGSSAKDIVLADGTYDNSTYFSVGAAHRLWAEHLGGATLTAGLLLDKSGSEVHGLKFDVSDEAKTSNRSIIFTGTSGHNLTVTDSWFEGRLAVARGIHIMAVNGVRLQRLVVSHFTWDGIRVFNNNSSYPITPNPPPYIADLDLSYFKHPDPNCCSGTGEFGLLLGNSAPGAIVERIKCRYADWSCLIPAGVDVSGTIWRDLDLDYSNDQTFYFEHFGTNVTLERFHIGPHVSSAMCFEGALPNWGWKPVGHTFIIQDGTIESNRLGITIGCCEGDITVRRVKFVGQCYAAILDNTNHSYAQGQCTPYGPHHFEDNDYSGILSTAEQVKINAPGFGSGICDGGDTW